MPPVRSSMRRQHAGPRVGPVAERSVVGRQGVARLVESVCALVLAADEWAGVQVLRGGPISADSVACYRNSEDCSTNHVFISPLPLMSIVPRGSQTNFRLINLYVASDM